MDDKFIIENETLSNSLLALAIMCNKQGTDNCNLTISTDKGKIACHIEFSGKLDSHKVV